MKAAILICLLLPAVAMAYKWESCGTRYDRLKVSTLSFSGSPGVQAGANATIHITGTTDLHAPLVSGAWQVRIYELGFSHAIATSFGDLSDALHFTDPKATAYEMTVTFPLPAPKGPDQVFTASLTSQDQQHAVYECIEIMYSYNGTVAEAAPVVAVEEPKAVEIVAGPHFWSCADSPLFEIQKISITPAAPTPGKPVSISATGTSKEVISGGTLKYEAGIDGIPLIHQTKQLCDVLKEAHLACPVAAGPVDISLDINLPSFIPAGNYTAKGNGYDQNGNLLLCLQGYIVIA